MVHFIRARYIFTLFVLGSLAGCVEGKPPFGLGARAGDSVEPGAVGSTRLVEHDVEAPEVFQISDLGHWDGRPSLGGVWVAHASAKDPERVIIRNEANGKFVIGALFRRERDFPGPKFQLSADAAAALGIDAEKPVKIQVTALRRDAPADAPAGTAASGTASPPASGAALPADAPSEVPIALAPTAPQDILATSGGATRPDTPSGSAGYIQIGIFAVEDNADRAVQHLRQAGLDAQLRQSQIGGKSYWRVTVGPAKSADMLAKGLTKVKSLGYSDAYAVKG